jgi:cytochrome c oxidase subunit 2
MLAGATILNDLTHLAAWISHPQGIKPGARMPDLGLTGANTAAIVSYLESLR